MYWSSTAFYYSNKNSYWDRDVHVLGRCGAGWPIIIAHYQCLPAQDFWTFFLLNLEFMLLKCLKLLDFHGDPRLVRPSVRENPGFRSRCFWPCFARRFSRPEFIPPDCVLPGRRGREQRKSNFQHFHEVGWISVDFESLWLSIYLMNSQLFHDKYW